MLKLVLVGNIGQDATIKDFGTSKYIAFSVAHSESYTNKAGVKVEKTQWVSCLKYVKDETKLTEYLKKGTKVYIEGSLSISVFEKGGKHEAGVNCLISHLELLSKKEEGTQDSKAEPMPIAPEPHCPTHGEDDLPF